MFGRRFFLICLWLIVALVAMAQRELSRPLPPQLVHLFKCGNSRKMVDDCFKDLPSHLMDFLQNTKTVVSKQEITAKCNTFNRGLKCFDDYSSRCLQSHNLDTFRNNVESARKFFNKFCGDDDFQRDYLRHKDCLAYIQMDWVSATAELDKIPNDKLNDPSSNSNSKFADFCSARHAYENCIYTRARYKCYKMSTGFEHETATTVSHNYAVSKNVCGQAHRSLGSPFALLMILFVVKVLL